MLSAQGRCLRAAVAVVDQPHLPPSELGHLVGAAERRDELVEWVVGQAEAARLAQQLGPDLGETACRQHLPRLAAHLSITLAARAAAAAAAAAAAVAAAAAAAAVAVAVVVVGSRVCRQPLQPLGKRLAALKQPPLVTDATAPQLVDQLPLGHVRREHVRLRAQIGQPPPQLALAHLPQRLVLVV